MPDNQEKPSYLDENLSEGEKQSGHTRLPMANEEGKGEGQANEQANEQKEQPYPGEEQRNDRNFERPDEFGDGDRRS